VLTIGFELGDIVLKVPILKNVEMKRLLGVVLVLALAKSSGCTAES